MTKNEKKLMAVIADAVAGLEKANNPHVVKVRENLRKVVLHTFTETSMKNLVNWYAKLPENVKQSESVKQYQATQEFFNDVTA